MIGELVSQGNNERIHSAKRSRSGRCVERTQMKVVYNRGNDALSIHFHLGSKPIRRVQIDERVNLELDGKGRLVALEVRGAGDHLSASALDGLELVDREMTLIEAAETSGLAANTLRVLLHRRRLEGHKRGRDWFVAAASLIRYLASRDPRGRPPVNLKARRTSGS
jgi:uncharacterized protein YuzE